MQLEELKTFVEITNFKSFTKAAQNLNISQPTASLHIKNLENEFNALLFVRTKRTFHMTPAGKLLYKRAIQLLKLAEQTKEEILWQHKEVNGVLRIAASYTVGESVIPNIIVKFHKMFPNFQFEIMIKNTEDVELAIRELTSDIGFIEGTVKASELIVQPFKKDQLILVASKTHPLARKSTIQVDELLSTHWVMREKGSGTREYTDYLLQAIGNITPSKTIISTNEGVKQIVLNGLGVAVVSTSSVKNELGREELVKLAVDIKPLERTFAVLTAPLMAQKKHIQVFLDELFKHVNLTHE